MLNSLVLTFETAQQHGATGSSVILTALGWPCVLLAPFFLIGVSGMFPSPQTTEHLWRAMQELAGGTASGARDHGTGMGRNSMGMF